MELFYIVDTQTYQVDMYHLLRLFSTIILGRIFPERLLHFLNYFYILNVLAHISYSMTINFQNIFVGYYLQVFNLHSC